jgi:hypothetical protein
MRNLRLTPIFNLSLVLLAIAVLSLGCGGKTASTGNSLGLPEWFQAVPEDPGYIFAVATSTSRDLGMSVNKAKQQARVDIAQQMETKVKSMIKQFNEEVGLGEEAEFLSQTTEVSKSVTSKVLNGSKAKKVETVKEGEIIYRSYVLMEMPIGPANAALMEAIKKQQNMYTRFRASQGFQELEGEIDKYDQFKKEQGLAP